MSETVALAMITAAAGFLGAALGAVGAVFGPWWLRRYERRVTDESDRAESQRAAIVEWTNAQIALANAMYGPTTDGRRALATAVNEALTELISRLEAKDGEVRSFIRGASTAIAMYPDPVVRRVAAARAGEALLAWHKGVGPEVPMVPYFIVDRGSSGARWSIANLQSWEQVHDAIASPPMSDDVEDESVALP